MTSAQKSTFILSRNSPIDLNVCHLFYCGQGVHQLQVDGCSIVFVDGGHPSLPDPLVAEAIFGFRNIRFQYGLTGTFVSQVASNTINAVRGARAKGIGITAFFESYLSEEMPCEVYTLFVLYTHVLFSLLGKYIHSSRSTVASCANHGRCCPKPETS